MINIAVICEYNPFHNGHREQIERIRELFNGESVRIIALMSGNFVQRGDLACVQKYKRAEFAINNGVDLVLELPYPLPCRSAEEYAYGAVRYLDSLGDIDLLCFGSESGNTDRLTLAAKRLLSKEFESKIREAATEDFGSSYASLRSALYRDLFADDLPDTPNDILGVEYIKSIIKLGSGIKPLVLKRVSAMSATASRKAAAGGGDLSRLVPFDVEAYMTSNKCVGLPDLEDHIIPYLMTSTPEELSLCRDVNYDLAVKLINAAKCSLNIQTLEDRASDKRYTRARVRRAVISCVLRDHEEETDSPLFSVMLASNRSGREYLSESVKNKNTVFTKRSEIKDREVLRAYEKLSAADALYNYVLKKNGIEIIKKPFIIQ